MNTSRITAILSLTAWAVLGLGFGNSASGGPGPQYFQQMERIRTRNAAQQSSTAAAAKPGQAPAGACPNCRTTALQESAFHNASGKIAPRAVVVGKIHSCGGCTGVITQRAGHTRDEMNRTCPVCAKAAPNCCSTAD